MGHEAKILMPYIHALKDVVLRLYLIDCAIPSDVLSALKGGASSSERFTSETENVLRGIDIIVV